MKKRANPLSKPSLLLLLDFCNIRTWNVETILELHRKYDMGLVDKSTIPGDFCWDPHSKDSRLQDTEQHGGLISVLTDRSEERQDQVSEPQGGREVHCRTRLDDRHIYCLTQESTTTALHKAAPDVYLLPTQAEFARLWDWLQLSQERYRAFLDKCINEEDLDIHFLMTVINVFENIQWAVLKNEHVKWKFHAYPDPYRSDLETHIDFQIASVIMRDHSDEIFPYIRRCKSCESYYMAPTLHKRKYCSRTCKQKSTWPKERHLEYMRQFRKKHKVKAQQQRKSEYEEQIQKMMEALDISREAAVELIEADKDV